MLAFFFFYVVPIRKKTVLENLKIAFPDLTDRQLHKLAFKSYKSFALSLIEILCLPHLKETELLELVKCPDVEIIREKYAQNKGVILLTAHFGNWEMGAAMIGVRLNLPVYVVAKPQRNELVTDWLTNMRETFGNKVVMLGMSIRNVYKELYNKNIVGLVGDQRGPKEGDRVNFFGRPTAIYSGTATLAVKTGSPIVAAFIVRDEDNTYTAFIEDINLEDLPSDEKERISAVNQKYMDLLEKYIRQHPEQWLWMHKRWKY